MKTMTCRQLGGECDFAIRAETSSEMANKMTEHVIKAHPGLAEEMKNMSPRQHERWEEKFHDKWDKAPEISEMRHTNVSHHLPHAA